MPAPDPLIATVRAAVQRGDVARADALLRERLAKGDDPAIRVELVRLLHFRGRFAEALDQLGSIDSEPLLRAALLGRLARHDEAIAEQRRALAISPHPRAWLGMSHLLKTIGDFDGAADASREALVLAPTSGEAWWSLANLKTYRFSAEERAKMDEALADPALDPLGRSYLQFARARAFDQAGDVEQSWEALADANALRASQLAYDPQAMTDLVDATIAMLDADFFAARAGAGDPSDAPIFILGMPRSGSTLVEQMLASHSAIEGTMELPDLAAIARGLGGTEGFVDQRYLAAVAALPFSEFADLGAAYLDRTRVHRRLGRAHFVDKMPNNWLFTGLIRLIMPHARIIDVRRNPLDCCLSNFREQFARGQGYSYDLGHIGRFYADYVRLMDHIDRVQPGTVHRLVYEQLIDDPEAELRRLFAYLDLPFEPDVLRFHETDRAVRTASAAQVRRPLNRAGIGQWRAYERWLGPLKDALGESLENWDSPQG